MTFKISENKYYPILVTAFFALILSSFLFICRSFYPFGNGSTMIIDMYSQYLPLLYRFYDVITGNKNIFYDFTVSGGINLYSETLNELCNPFNYILLLWPREQLYLAVNVLLMLYLSASACSAHFFLIHIGKKCAYLDCVLSICYAFSGYFMYNFQIIKWMIFPVIFPLFLLCLLRLFHTQKGVMFSILLAYQIIQNIQLGFMTVLFVLFASGIWMFCIESKNNRKSFCLHLGIYTIIGLMLSSISLLPTIYTLLSSARSGANTSYFDLFTKHGLNDLFERLFQFIHPILLGFFIYFILRTFLQRKSILSVFQLLVSEKDFRFFFALYLFLLFTVLFQPANLFWHLGSYFCFPVRYGYMLLLLYIALIKIVSCHKITSKNTNTTKKQIILVLFCILVVLTSCILVLTHNELNIVQAFSSLAISSTCKRETLLVILILLGICFATILSLFQHRIRVLCMILTIVACSYCYFTMISLPDYYELRQTNEANYKEMTEQALLHALHNPLQREKQNISFHKNASLVSSSSSLSGYFSTADASFQAVMKNLGYLTPWISTIDIGGTKISDYLFRHVLLLPGNFSEYTLSEHTPLENQQLLLRMLLPDDATQEELNSIFHIIDAKTLVTLPNNNITLTLPDSCTLYLDLGFNPGKLNVIIDGIAYPLTSEPTDVNPHHLITLGSLPKGALSISLTDSNGNPISLDIAKIGILHEKNWDELLTTVATIQDEKIQFISEGTHCKIHIKDLSTNDNLWLPFCSADGWTVTSMPQFMNQSIPLQKVFHCFLSVDLDESIQELTFTFFPPWLSAGVVLSLLGFILLLSWMFFKKTALYPLFLSKCNALQILYVVILIVAILFIYVIPTLGFLYYIFQKILQFIV